MQQPLKASESIVKSLMPSAWETYKHSLMSSVVGIARFLFSFRGVNVEGTYEKRYGVLWVIFTETIGILTSLLKIAIATCALAVAVPLFIFSPIVNLVMLPFYRRKSVIELKKFIDEQEGLYKGKKKQVDEALGGAA